MRRSKRSRESVLRACRSEMAERSACSTAPSSRASARRSPSCRIGTLAIIIGFGVNVAFAPTGTPYPAAALQTVKPDLTREDLLRRSPQLSPEHFQPGGMRRASIHPIRSAPFGASGWNGPPGSAQEVTLRLPSGEKKGIFEGLDRFGRLQLKSASGWNSSMRAIFIFPICDMIRPSLRLARQGFDQNGFPQDELVFLPSAGSAKSA